MSVLIISENEMQFGIERAQKSLFTHTVFGIILFMPAAQAIFMANSVLTSSVLVIAWFISLNLTSAGIKFNALWVFRIVIDWFIICWSFNSLLAVKAIHRRIELLHLFCLGD